MVSCTHPDKVALHRGTRILQHAAKFPAVVQDEEVDVELLRPSRRALLRSHPAVPAAPRSRGCVPDCRAKAYDGDPSKPIGNIKAAWETAKLRAGYNCGDSGESASVSQLFRVLDLAAQVLGANCRSGDWACDRSAPGVGGRRVCSAQRQGQ